MEKHVPHCKLARVWELLREDKVDFTVTALSGAAALGMDREGIVSVIYALSSRDFYKSMTTFADHRIWQDVYRPLTPSGQIYLKLTVTEGVLVVSFKEL